MRYTVGKDYIFLSLFFKSERLDGSPYSREDGLGMFVPWRDSDLLVEIETLHCESYHKVPVDWEDETKYDGFIFRSASGETWHNQYPRASYGQLDTSNDYVVRPAERDPVKPPFYGRRDATTSLETILRGMKDILQYGATREKRESLGNLYNMLATLIESKCNVWVTHKPIEFERTDGTIRVHEDIRGVIIIPKSEPEPNRVAAETWQAAQIAKELPAPTLTPVQKNILDKIRVNKLIAQMKEFAQPGTKQEKPRTPQHELKTLLKSTPPLDGTQIIAKVKSKKYKVRASFDAEWGKGRGSWFTETGEAFATDAIEFWEMI